jgi:hypothetical protein
VVLQEVVVGQQEAKSAYLDQIEHRGHFHHWLIVLRLQTSLIQSLRQRLLLRRQRQQLQFQLLLLQIHYQNLGWVEGLSEEEAIQTELTTTRT